jgi:hypothetical protein
MTRHPITNQNRIPHPMLPNFYAVHKAPVYDDGGVGGLIITSLQQLPGVLAFGTGKLPRNAGNRYISQGPLLNYRHSVTNVGLGGNVTGSFALTALLEENPQL